MKLLGILFFSFLTLFSCTSDNEEPVYHARELYDLAVTFDPSIEIVPITDPAKRIICENYGPGCIQGSGKRVKVRKVELVVLEFQTPALAKAEAKRLNQYYTRNWLLDDVKGEPVLESFVKSVYDAKNPQ